MQMPKSGGVGSQRLVFKGLIAWLFLLCCGPVSPLSERSDCDAFESCGVYEKPL